MNRKAFSGVMTAIITPFTKKKELDINSFKKLLDNQKSAGINGVIVGGTTGESPSLSTQELDELVAVALEFQDDTFFVNVGTGSNSTHHTIEKSLHYANFKHNGRKPDGIMTVVPYYNKPNQQGLFEHFSAIASEIPNTPLCLYNVPGRTHVSLSPQTLAKLVEKYSNIVAIKEAAGDIQTMAEMRILNPNLTLLSGDDATFAGSLLYGANGVISVTSHIIPKAMLDIVAYAKKGMWHEVSELNLKILPINKEMFCAPNPIPIKWALHQLGFCENELRLPMTPLDEVGIVKVTDAMNKAKNTGVELRSCN